MSERVCERKGCWNSLEGMKSTARHCSPACRIAASKSRRAQGDAYDAESEATGARTPDRVAKPPSTRTRRPYRKLQCERCGRLARQTRVHLPGGLICGRCGGDFVCEDPADQALLEGGR